MRPEPGPRDGEVGFRRVSDSDDDADRPNLGRRDIWRLVWATYVTTFPLLLVFLLALALATWLITEVLF